ncbi:MAG TPA: DnaD domain protein [Bacilli bacterium]|nr:DnaD domain protein [Bacilli bacterium]
MIPDALDFRFLLINYYKKIGLNEKELAVIFVIDYLIQEKNDLITGDILSLKMNFSAKEIDDILVNLLHKGYLEYNTDQATMRTTLNPLRQRLYQEFQIEMSNEAKQSSDDNPTEKVVRSFQSELGRNLSPAEIQRVREWIAYGYDANLIIDALKEALSKNRRSIKAVDRILLEWATSEDVKKEGYSAQNESWKNDIDKTIAIAKEKWLDFDDDDK